MNRAFIFAWVTLAGAGLLSARQPVMDMVPRWAGGWGFQYFHEFRMAEDLFSGASEVANPDGLRKEIRTSWLEGVYTFDRARRITFKMPYLDQERVALVGGTPVTQRGHGLGDIVVATPLKRYTNLPGLTYNFGVTPQLRLPTGKTTADYPVGDGSWDPGLSVSFSSESARWYHLYDLTYWKNTRGSAGMRKGDELMFDINIGRAFPFQERHSSVFVMLDVQSRWMDRDRTSTSSGGESVSVGPMLMYVKLYDWGTMAVRAEYRLPVYERWNGTQTGNEQRFALGIGFAF